MVARERGIGGGGSGPRTGPNVGRTRTLLVPTTSPPAWESESSLLGPHHPGSPPTLQHRFGGGRLAFLPLDAVPGWNSSLRPPVISEFKFVEKLSAKEGPELGHCLSPLGCEGPEKGDGTCPRNLVCTP